MNMPVNVNIAIVNLWTRASDLSVCLQKMQESDRKTLMDIHDYVMYGKIFKYKDSSKAGQIKVEVFISFGGLLMQLIGDPKKLETLEVDNNVYLCMRKV